MRNFLADLCLWVLEGSHPGTCRHAPKLPEPGHSVLLLFGEQAVHCTEPGCASRGGGCILGSSA